MAQAPTVILKNDSGGPLTVAEFGGLTIADSAQVTLSDLFTFSYIVEQYAAIATEVAAADFIVNDGSGDLSPAEALQYLTYFSEKDHLDTDDTAPHVDDALVPTTDEKAALAGTGTPSAGNVFVTDDDARLAAAEDHMLVAFGKAGGSNNQYLRTGAGPLSNLTGFRMIRACTVSGISVEQNSTSQTPTIEVRKNDAAGVLDSVTIVSGQSGIVDAALAVALVANDRLQIYCNGASTDATVLVELKL